MPEYPIAFTRAGEHHGPVPMSVCLAMVRLLIGVAALVAVFAGVTHAQLPPLPVVGPLLNGERPDPGENALQQAESERLHRATLKNIPDRKASKDPWHSIRPDATQIDRHRPY
jgi:hypothetical protein